MAEYNSSFAYAKGQVVAIGPNMYKANDDIPIGVIFTEGVVGQTWLRMGDPILSAPDHVDNRQYSFGQLVVRGGKFYRAKRALTTLDIWVDADWENVGG